MTPDDVMTPRHPDWDEFVDRVTEALAGPTAVATGDVDLIVRASHAACNSKYRGLEPFESTRAVLATMDMDMDIEASIAFFRLHGRGCDCEVLMNVAPVVELQEEQEE